jgi:lysophospholipase L1-like esterase
VRVVLTNVFGTAPLAIGAARLGLRDKGAAIVPKSDQPLMFGGSLTTTIPAGAVMVSDPVNLTVTALADLAIDIYLPGDTSATTSPLTIHAAAHQNNYVSPSGDHSGAVEMPVMTMTQSWFFLARVEVTASEQTTAVVAIGDSITDGTNSTLDGNSRWPDHLARRLNAQHISMGVLNLGNGGNQLLSGDIGNVGGLARFDRDVLAQTGVTHVIVLWGINDIRRGVPPPTADAIIAGHKQLIERAHAHGLRIYGATLTPFENNLWTPEREAKRQTLNEWIRTSKAYDAVIDFDAVSRDPSSPTKLLHDSGDHIHPNDLGYQTMASAVELGLLKTSRRSAAATR